MRHQAAIAIALAACGGATTHPPPWGAQPPKLEDELALVERADRAITSYRADAVLNGSTSLEIEADADHFRLRTPQVELVCDGESLTMIDHARACARIDSCDEALATVLGPRFIRDELRNLASGTVSVIRCGPFAGEVTWDALRAREHVDYGFEEANGERCTLEQEIEIDRRDGRRDVVASRDKNGSLTLSRVEYDGFHEIIDGTGLRLRVPAHVRYGDLRIDWRKVELNVALGSDAFRLDLPAGMPTCP